MIISDLQHLEIVSEETQIQGQGGYEYKHHSKHYFNTAFAKSGADSQAYGDKTKAFTLTDTDAYSEPGFSASSSDSKSVASSSGSHH